MRSFCAMACALFVVSTAALTRAELPGYDASIPCPDYARAFVPPELPANTPGILVEKTAKGLVTLLAPDGTELSRKVTEAEGLQVLEIPEPLVVGQVYSVATSSDCGSNKVTFKATAEVALPTSAGTVSAVTPSFSPSFYRCDAAGNPIGTQRVFLRFQPSLDLEPFLGVSDVDLVIDGVVQSDKLYAGTRPGGAAKGAELGSVTLSCPSAPVSRRVSATVSVAGMPRISTAELVVDLQCPAPVPLSKCAPAETDAGTMDAGTDAPRLDGGEVGCSTTGSGLGLFGWTAIAGVLGVVARRLRGHGRP